MGMLFLQKTNPGSGETPAPTLRGMRPEPAKPELSVDLEAAYRPQDAQIATRALGDAIDLRNRGARQLAIWSARALIGATFIGLAFVFADATTASNTFFAVGGASLLGAIVMFSFVSLRGAASNKGILKKADTVGKTLAARSVAFDKLLSGATSAPTYETRDLSAKRPPARKAKAFFDEIAFLSDHNASADQHSFRQFLNKPTLRAGASGYLRFGYALLFVATALAVAFALGAPAAIGFESAAAPWAPHILIVGVAVFALAGFLIDGAADAFVGASDAERRALASVRQAYDDAGAPNPMELLGRSEEAIGREKPDTFTNQSPAYAALSKSEMPTRNFENAPPASAPSQQHDSTFQFVETDFAATPARWRTDAYSKKMTASARPKPATKRSP